LLFFLPSETLTKTTIVKPNHMVLWSYNGMHVFLYMIVYDCVIIYEANYIFCR
jgi:hypothetical protein